MLQSYKLFDADAHTMMSPRMWETLPSEYRARRPRLTRVHDASFGSLAFIEKIKGELGVKALHREVGQ